MRALRRLAMKRAAWRSMLREHRRACMRAAFRLRLLKAKLIKHMIRKMIRREVARQLRAYHRAWRSMQQKKRDDGAHMIAIRKFDSSKGKLIGVTINLKAAFVSRSRYTNKAKKSTPMALRAAVAFKLALAAAHHKMDDDTQDKTLVVVTPSKTIECVARPSGGHVAHLPMLRALARAHQRFTRRQPSLMRIFAHHAAAPFAPLMLAIKRIALAAATAPISAKSDLDVLTKVIAGARLSIKYHYVKPKAHRALTRQQAMRMALLPLALRELARMERDNLRRRHPRPPMSPPMQAEHAWLPIGHPFFRHRRRPTRTDTLRRHPSAVSPVMRAAPRPTRSINRTPMRPQANVTAPITAPVVRPREESQHQRSLPLSLRRRQGLASIEQLSDHELFD